MNLRKEIFSGQVKTGGQSSVRYFFKKMLFSAIILSGIISVAETGFAQEQDYGIKDDNQTLRFTGATLVNGANNFKAFTPGTESRYTITNVVTLSLNEETNSFIPNDFDATLRVKIEYGHSSGTTTPIEQDLKVTYKKAEAAKYDAKNYFHFSGAEYVKITIVSDPVVVGNIGSLDIKTLLFLDYDLKVTRYYDQLGNTPDLQPTLFTNDPPATNADEMTVNWTWSAAAKNTHTQLEWAWVETELLSTYPDENAIFKTNATRIDLPKAKTSYKIPLLYGGSGKIYFRVRAVNMKKEGRVDGPWSVIKSQTFGGHMNSDLVNWQATTSYAEEGKRKSVMQYYDGSLRNRQTVTKENVNNTTIVAETFYDDQGRPAVQVLPVPGIGTNIAYTKGLNLFKSNSSLNLLTDQVMTDNPVKFFDLQPIATPTSITPALLSSSGASKYYSADNTTGDASIPDAEGYPYTVTRYTPDATGRVMAQSGVGAAMQMGKGHETKYFYGTPAQEELDALFGTEVGNYTHYFKNMVKDANGQMSVSYVDMQGRTIATALAGDSGYMRAIYTNATQYPGQQGTSVTRNLLNAATNVAKNNSIEAINTILVPAAANYAFKYKLAPDKLQLSSCLAATLCYDCMYDLEISIANESGDEAPIIRKFKNINLNADDNCSTATDPFSAVPSNPATTVAGDSIMFNETLLPGSYIVRKTLTLSESSLQRYKELYATIDKGLCKTEQQLIDSVYQAMLSVSNCDDPPLNTCTECRDSLGTFSQYRTKYLAALRNPNPVPATVEAAILASFNEASLNCDRLCNTVSQSLPTKRSLMLADMVPYSGQYAKEVGTASTMYNKYDIFSTVNAGQPFYKKPLNSSEQLNYYYNTNNIIDPTVHPGTPPDQSAFLNNLSKGDFAQLFNYKWAEALLPYHPEYDRLLFAESKLTASYNWINTFSNTSTYADAATNGYIFTAEANLTDPFYSVSPAPANTKAMMATKVNNAYVSKDGTNLSMWQIAYGDVKCKNILAPEQRKTCYTLAPKIPPYNDLTTAEKDQVWNMFKSLYAMERDNHVNAYIAANVPLGDVSTLVQQGYLLQFPDNTNQLTQQFTNNGNNWSWWPANAGDPPNLNNFPGATTTAQAYTSQCDSYISLWKQALLQCEKIKNHASKDLIINEITTGMALVCQKGSDQANPQGSSNVAPGTPYDGSPRSFEEVINAVFAKPQYNISRDTLCNPFIIEFPKPYGKGPTFIKEFTSVVDTCNCGRLEQLKIEAGAAANNLSSFNQYLLTQYGDTLTTALYNEMTANCSRLNSLACSGDCGDRKCETTATSYNLISPQPMPEFLKCGFTGNAKCLDCAQLSSLTAEFKTQFSAPYNAGPVFSGNDLSPTNVRDNILFARFLNYRTGFQYGWMDYAKAAANASPSCNLADYNNNGNAHQNVICGNIKTLTDTTGIVLNESPCQKVYTMAAAMAQNIYKQRVETLLADFEAAYRAKCYSAKNAEQFTVTYTNKEYHYTLYYYDRAGNLVKTVPPKGARPNWTATHLNNVKTSRANNYATNYPVAHLFTTQYRYNSLNQVTAQATPDAGRSDFWYDKLGRLAVSQNAQQKLDAKYSFTVYDVLGRIEEVGQKPHTTAMGQATSQDPVALSNWLMNTGGTMELITKTKYDMAYGEDAEPPMNILEGLVKQKNLRNRVSYTLVLPSASDPEAYHAATFYTYDIHGNVDTLVQDYKGIAETGVTDRFKQIVYDYDLISGKVNMVSYQPDRYNAAMQLWEVQKDKFFHKYSYDAENRLIQVETSRDKIVWEEDAKYNYYKHGPLSRMVLGKQQVQGVDYAYTLQGWLKGVNGTTVSDGTFDIGKDGLPTSSNSKVARDVVGYALHYYDAVAGSDTWLDYKPIIGSSSFARPVAASNMVSLYNGNIAAMSVNNAGLLKAPAATTNAMPLFYNYRYDQLNRIVSMQAYKGLDAAANQWVPVAINDYKEAITYDPNGNILTYNRKGSPSITGKQLEMDNLTYNYIANTNKLNYVTDPTPIANYTEDIDAQTTGNYTYDAIGNLKKDIKEGLGTTTTDGIFWNVYGKITSIVKASSTITYTYDAAGNRISKTVSGGNTTVYVRDASGNVMSVYETPASITALKQKETHLYGSNRFGIAGEQTATPADVNLSGGFGVAKLSVFARGEKMFELGNHLGNVLATVTDKKIAHDAGNGTIDYYSAVVVSATDYAPFGMALVNRKWNSGNYRYGFNGKENDNEVKGEGNQQDYGFRIYDPRLGKFLSVDPLTKSYPWYTPYQFAGNKPINSVDLDGLEEYESIDAYKKDKGSAALEKMDGSDGAWLESDRTARNSTWSNAMEAITKNNWSDKLRDNPGDQDAQAQKNIGSAFGVVRDYYLWVQNKMDGNGFKSKWAQGASYLVDELASTYEEGLWTMGGAFPKMGRLLRDLNFGISEYAVGKFKEVLYDGVVVGNSHLDWYNWDKEFVTKEQGPVAFKIYNDWKGTIGLDFLNDLSRKGGWFNYAKSYNYFPNFATFDGLNGKGDAYLNEAKDGFAVYQRTNIPLFMLWPSTHATMSNISLNGEQQKEINKANEGIKKFYEANKIK